MRQCEVVYELLKKLDIAYDVIEHPPVLTTEDADAYIEGKEGVPTKSLFLCNRKKTSYYLVIMDDSKRLDMKNLAKIVDEKSMSFCSPERLMEKMSLEPGAVSIFGLLNNKDKDIRVCIDKEMLIEKFICFHPNDNTKTIFISMNDMLKYLKNIGYEYSIIEL